MLHHHVIPSDHTLGRKQSHKFVYTWSHTTGNMQYIINDQNGRRRAREDSVRLLLTCPLIQSLRQCSASETFGHRVAVNQRSYWCSQDGRCLNILLTPVEPSTGAREWIDDLKSVFQDDYKIIIINLNINFQLHSTFLFLMIQLHDEPHLCYI